MPLPSFRMGEAYNAIDSSLLLNLDAANYSGTGTNWNDATRNSNNATLINGTGYTTANNGAMAFDGVNDYVDCGPASYLNSSLTGLTVSVWVYSTSRGAICFLENGISYDQNTFYLFQEDTSTYTFCTTFLVNRFRVRRSATIYPINVWVHLVGTWSSGNEPNLYLNGVLDNGAIISAGAIPTSLRAGNTNLMIGARPNNAQNALNGKIAQAKIYNRELSAYEVNQQFQATRARYGI